MALIIPYDESHIEVETNLPPVQLRAWIEAVLDNQRCVAMHALSATVVIWPDTVYRSPETAMRLCNKRATARIQSWDLSMLTHGTVMVLSSAEFAQIVQTGLPVRVVEAPTPMTDAERIKEFQAVCVDALEFVERYNDDDEQALAATGPALLNRLLLVLAKTQGLY